jgi:hypothetical protein
MAQKPGLKLRQPIRYGDGARERREERGERRGERGESREGRGERGGVGIGKTAVVLTNNRSGSDEG